MADKKISALTASATPLAGTEVLPIVQSGATVKVAVSDLTAGRAVSATQLTLSTENLVIGTAAKGIDFSANANAPGMTSELLNWYEQGTWTPSDGSGAGLSLTVANATYTRIGRLVTANFAITYPATASASTSRLGGLPFTSSSAGFSFPMVVSTCQTGICKSGLVDTSATTFLLLDTTATALTNVQMSGLFLRGTVIYEV
jgi:hypothetical protein